MGDSDPPEWKCEELPEGRETGRFVSLPHSRRGWIAGSGGLESLQRRMNGGHSQGKRQGCVEGILPRRGGIVLGRLRKFHETHKKLPSTLRQILLPKGETGGGVVEDLWHRAQTQETGQD